MKREEQRLGLQAEPFGASGRQGGESLVRQKGGVAGPCGHQGSLRRLSIHLRRPGSAALPGAKLGNTCILIYWPHDIRSVTFI